MEMNVLQLINGTVKTLEAIPMGKNTVVFYGRCFAAIERFCSAKGYEHYSINVRDSFVAQETQRAENGDIGWIYWSGLRKAADMMLEYQSTGAVAWQRRKPRLAPLPDYFASILKSFTDSLSSELTVGTIDNLEIINRQMLAYFNKNNHDRFDQIGIDIVRKFITVATPNWQGNIGNLFWAVKRFFGYLNKNGYTDLDVATMLHSPAPNRKKVLPRFTNDEVSRILGAADTSTPCGKRDYAIMMIAAEVGLRTSDIKELKLSSIDWRSNEIKVQQKKTGNFLVLPLGRDVGNAIADYILNARPKADTPYIFLRSRHPHVKLGETAGANIIIRHLEKAGIGRKAYDGKTFHAFRRTAGTNLIESGAGIVMTAQVLGHLRIESAKRYISLDENSLLECCMPLTGLETTREGLR